MYGLKSLTFISMLAVASAGVIPAPLAARDFDLIARQNTTSAGTNIQTFTTNLPAPFDTEFIAPAVYYDASADDGTGNSKAFTENGKTFNNAISALEQSCNDQQQTCNQASNDGSSGVTTQQCGTQQQACNTAVQAISKQYTNNKKRDGGKFRGPSKREEEEETEEEDEE